MFIDYIPKYSHLEEHKDTKKNDLLYVAYFDEDGKVITKIAKILDIRQEHNPYYLRGRGSSSKYLPPEYNVVLVSYEYKNIFNKMIGKKSPVYSKTFWVDSVFFRTIESEAWAALLAYVKNEETEKACDLLGYHELTYLSRFKNNEKNNFSCSSHYILNYFKDIYRKNRERKKQEEIKNKLELV